MASKGVITLEDLAEQGVGELVDITELSEEKAGELIMAARNTLLATNNLLTEVI